MRCLHEMILRHLFFDHRNGKIFQGIGNSFHHDYCYLEIHYYTTEKTALRRHSLRQNVRENFPTPYRQQ